MFTPMRLTACRSLWVAGLLLIGATPGRAITINIDYAPENDSPFEANNVTGITLTTLFEAAAAIWEDFLPNSGTYNICVSWDDDLGAGILGNTDPVSGDIDLLADPVNSGTLSAPAPWFIDTAPFDHSEFTLIRREASSLSQAEINAYFNGSSLPPTLEIGFLGGLSPGSPAANRWDALSVALHELGHALGVNSLSGDTWVPSLHMTGGQTVIIDNTEEDDGHVAVPGALMFISPNVFGARVMPSTIDILAVAADEGFADVDLPRQSFLQVQPTPNDPDFSWHTGPFFWEGGELPGTDDQALITNGARIALQTGDVHIASLVISGDSVLKTNNRTMLVDGSTNLSGDLTGISEILVGAGGSLETTILSVPGGILRLDSGTVLVNQSMDITAATNVRDGMIIGHGTVQVTERLENEGLIKAEGGTLTLTTPPAFPQVWDLDGDSRGTVEAVDGDIVVQGPHEGQYDTAMTIGRGRSIELDSPWVMGKAGVLHLNGSDGAPATFRGDVSEIGGEVIADKLGVLEGGSYIFPDTVTLNVPDSDDVLDLAAPSLFRGDPSSGYAVVGNGTLRQLSDIFVEADTNVDAAVFDWGNSAGGNVNELTVMPNAHFTVFSSATGTPNNEYRGTIRLNNGWLTVEELSGWTLPTDQAGVDRSLGTLIMNYNREEPTFTTVAGSDLSLGGVVRVETGVGRILAVFVTQPTAEIEVLATAILSLANDTTYDGPLVHGAGTLMQTGEALVVSPTTIGTSIYDWDGPFDVMSSTTIAPAASLTINSAQIEADPAPNNGYSGHVTVADTAALIVHTNGPWRLDGTMTLQGQPVTTPSVIVDGSDLINHGVIEGNGWIQSSLENHGTLSPGQSAGVLRFAAGFTLTSDGVVAIEIGGPTPLTEYDRIVVNQFGTANLGGDLSVSLINGFAPPAGGLFTILTAGVVSGVFDHELKGGLPPGLTYKVAYNTNSVVLAFLAGFTADFNMDGAVDGDDIAQWQSSYGVDAGGDANGDGITDGADYLIIQQQLGGSLPAAPAVDAVPEPGSVRLAFICGALLCAKRKRR